MIRSGRAAPRNTASLKRYAANTGWSIAERAVRIVGQLVIGVWLARHLGPDLFGTLNYALAFTAVFGGIAKFGLEPVLVTQFMQHRDRSGSLIGSALFLRLLSAAVLFVAGVGVARWLEPADSQTPLYVAVLGAGFFFQATDVVEFYFQANVKIRSVALSRAVQQVVSVVVKIYLIFNDYSLLWIVASFLLDQVVLALALSAALRISRERPRRLQVKWSDVSSLTREGLPLLLASVAVVVNMKIDQVMLANLSDARSVGIYAAAVRVSEAVYFVPALLTAALYPAVLNARERDARLYRQRTRDLYTLLLWGAIFISLTFAVASPFVIDLLYDETYARSSTVLAIHAWASPFVFLGVAGSRWFVAEGLHRYRTLFTAGGAVANVALNLALIPLLDEVGAAIATLVSYGLSAYVLPATSRQTRPFFWDATKALNPIHALSRRL